MRKLKTTVIMVVVCFFLSNSAFSQIDTLPIFLSNLFNRKEPLNEYSEKNKTNYLSTPGKKIEHQYLHLIAGCIDTFKLVMTKRGIDSIKGSKLSWRKRQMITFSEAFNGYDLLKWFKETVSTNDNAGLESGKNLKIVIEFGIYTEEFLQTIFPNDESQRKLRRGRITAFLVTYKYKSRTKATDGEKYDKVILADGDPLDAFDLGEINPPPKP